MATGHVESDIDAEQRRISNQDIFLRRCGNCDKPIGGVLVYSDEEGNEFCTTLCREKANRPQEKAIDVYEPLKPRLDAKKAEAASLIRGRRNLIGKEIAKAKTILLMLLIQLWNEEYTPEEIQIIEAFLADTKAKGGFDGF